MTGFEGLFGGGRQFKNEKPSSWVELGFAVTLACELSESGYRKTKRIQAEPLVLTLLMMCFLMLPDNGIGFQ